MSGQSNSDDDLTTDAIPSPPRDEVINEKKDEYEEPEHINVHPKIKTKPKVFGKPKKARHTGKIKPDSSQLSLSYHCSLR